MASIKMSRSILVELVLTSNPTATLQLLCLIVNHREKKFFLGIT